MDGHGLKRVHFDTRQLRERDRFPAVREELARQLLTVDCVNRSTKSFSAEFDISRIGRLAIADIHTSAADYIRTPELIRDAQEFLFITFPLRGRIFTSQGERGSPMRRGEVVLLDSTHTGGIHCENDSRYLTMRIARSEIAALNPPSTVFAGHSLDRDLVARDLLFSYVEATQSLDLGASEGAGRLYDAHIVDLVALGLGAKGEACEQAEMRGARAARRVALLRAIDRRSGDPGLSASAVAAQFGITPRYVHLLLEETGCTFTHHLLERRLDKAVALLSDPRWPDRKISDIALEAGFTDLSYFNRAFRRHYGVTPSDMRASARHD